jgi:hypothetical protein
MSGRHIELRFHLLEPLSRFHGKSYKGESSFNRFSVPKYMRIELEVTYRLRIKKSYGEKTKVSETQHGDFDCPPWEFGDGRRGAFFYVRALLHI